jgi:hypothetical protein
MAAETHWFLVDADHRFGRIVSLLINSEHLLHLTKVVLVQIWKTPHFFPATASGRGFAAVHGMRMAIPC